VRCFLLTALIDWRWFHQSYSGNPERLVDELIELGEFNAGARVVSHWRLDAKVQKRLNFTWLKDAMQKKGVLQKHHFHDMTPLSIRHDGNRSHRHSYAARHGHAPLHRRRRRCLYPAHQVFLYLDLAFGCLAGCLPTRAPRPTSFRTRLLQCARAHTLPARCTTPRCRVAAAAYSPVWLATCAGSCPRSSSSTLSQWSALRRSSGRGRRLCTPRHSLSKVSEREMMGWESTLFHPVQALVGGD